MKKREVAYPKKPGDQVVKYVTLKGELVDKLPKDDPVATIQITGDDPKAGEFHMLISLPVGVKLYKPQHGDNGFNGKAAMIHKIVAIVQSYKIVDVANIDELNDNTIKVVFTVDKAVPNTTDEAFVDIKEALKSLLNRHNTALGGDPVDDDDDDDDADDDDADDDDSTGSDDDANDDNTDDDDTNDDDDDSDEPDPFADEDDEGDEEITLEPGKGVTGFEFAGNAEEVLNLQRNSADFYTKLQGICGRKSTVTLPNGEVYQSGNNGSNS